MARTPRPSRRGQTPVILVVGDSLSAEYGLKRGEGWVPLLEKRLAEQKIAATVVNASISGDTTAGGRARLAGLLAQHKPTHVVLELGGNDALRGLPLAGTEDNLLQMTKAAQAAGAQVLIVGIQVPPNYGSDYTRRFEAMFAQGGRAHQGRAGALPAQGRGGRARRGGAVPGRPHPSDGRRAAAHAGQRVARAAQAARQVSGAIATKKAAQARARGGFFVRCLDGVEAAQPFLVGSSGTVGGSRSSEATSVSGSPWARPSLLGLSLRSAFSLSFSSFFFFLASSFWRFS